MESTKDGISSAGATSVEPGQDEEKPIGELRPSEVIAYYCKSSVLSTVSQQTDWRMAMRDRKKLNYDCELAT